MAKRDHTFANMQINTFESMQVSCQCTYVWATYSDEYFALRIQLMEKVSLPSTLGVYLSFPGFAEVLNTGC